jgi:hypothetical protein
VELGQGGFCGGLLLIRHLSGRYLVQNLERTPHSHLEGGFICLKADQDLSHPGWDCKGMCIGLSSGEKDFSALAGLA